MKIIRVLESRFSMYFNEKVFKYGFIASSYAVKADIGNNRCSYLWHLRIQVRLRLMRISTLTKIHQYLRKGTEKLVSEEFDKILEKLDYVHSEKVELLNELEQTKIFFELIKEMYQFQEYFTPDDELKFERKFRYFLEIPISEFDVATFDSQAYLEKEIALFESFKNDKPDFLRKAQ